MSPILGGGIFLKPTDREEAAVLLRSRGYLSDDDMVRRLANPFLGLDLCRYGSLAALRRAIAGYLCVEQG